MLIFGPFWVIFGPFFVLIFFGQKCYSAIFITFCISVSTQARNHTYCQRRHETTLAAQTYTTSEEHIVANYQSELRIIVIFLPLSPSRYISHPGPQIRRDTKSTGPQTPAFAFDSYLALLCIISSILLLMSTFKQNSPMSSTIFR